MRPGRRTEHYKRRSIGFEIDRHCKAFVFLADIEHATANFTGIRQPQLRRLVFDAERTLVVFGLIRGVGDKVNINIADYSMNVIERVLRSIAIAFKVGQNSAGGKNVFGRFPPDYTALAVDVLGNGSAIGVTP